MIHSSTVFLNVVFQYAEFFKLINITILDVDDLIEGQLYLLPCKIVDGNK